MDRVRDSAEKHWNRHKVKDKQENESRFKNYSFRSQIIDMLRGVPDVPFLCHSFIHLRGSASTSLVDDRVIIIIATR